MIKFIQEQKTHIIYGVIMIGLAAVGYNLLSSKPKEVVKTVVETKIVNRDVVKTQVKYVDRVIVKTEKDGTTTTTTEHVVTDGSISDKSKSQQKFVSQTTIKYLSRYSLEIQYPITVSFTGLNLPSFDPKNLRVIGGIRVFETPIFLTLGTDIGLNSALIGVRYEF